MKKNILIIAALLLVGTLVVWFMPRKDSAMGTIIILNGPSGSGKSSIQKEFQKLMMPNLWVKVGIDNLFDSVMPDITLENLAFWQSPNPIRWVETLQDDHGKNAIKLFVGEQGEKVVYAMNSAIADYARNGCNVIVDYIAYDQKWLEDLAAKCAKFTTYYVKVAIPLETLEEREAVRATSPQGHARSHYFMVYGDRSYDLVVDSGRDSAQAIAQQLQALVQ